MNKLLTLLFIGALVVASVTAEVELKVETIFKPDDCERTTQKGDLLKVHYTGTLEKNGQKFDSSLDRGEPFQLQLGQGQVIKGWEQGLLDMCKTEKRKLTVPPHLAYGDRGAGKDIGPGETLVFDVELVDFEEGEPGRDIFAEIDVDGNKQLSTDEVTGFIVKQQEEGGLDKSDPEELDKMISEIFASEDKDKDGHISHAEFSGPKHEEL